MSSIPVKTSKNFSFCFIFLNIFPGDRTTTTSVILWSYTVWMLNNSQQIQQKSALQSAYGNKHVVVLNMYIYSWTLKRMEIRTHGNTDGRAYAHGLTYTHTRTYILTYIHRYIYTYTCMIYIIIYMDYGHENAWKYVRTEIRAHGHTTIHNRLTKEI
jgi:hypothetical protein